VDPPLTTNATPHRIKLNQQVCNGLVLAADGKKMSKRLKNYPVR